MRKAGLAYQQQAHLAVHYDGVVVGDYVADLIVENTIIIEIKACQSLHDAHVAQSLNYLRATGLPVCLLMNFSQPQVEIKRLVH